MFNFNKLCFSLIALFAFMYISAGSCFASETPLLEGEKIDDVVAYYNKYFGKEKVGIVAGNKIQVGRRKEGGGVYAYSFNGRNDQIIRFYTNSNNDVLGFEIMLHMHSPVMKECVENKYLKRISMMIYGFLTTSGSLLEMKSDEMGRILYNLDQLKYYLDGNGRVWFINHNRKYWVEKSFDRSTKSLKVVVYVE